MKLLSLLRERTIDCETLAHALDDLDHPTRVSIVRNMPRNLMPKLFESVAGFKPLTLDDFVPRQLPAYAPVRHFGVNNLWAARNFEKVMYREASGVVAGRNVQTWDFATGHGYFTVDPADNGEVAIRYTHLPRSKPVNWPVIRSNSAGLSYFVYRDMVDMMRAVSDFVTIGRAQRHGRDLPNYFVLVRDRRTVNQVIAHPERRAG